MKRSSPKPRPFVLVNMAMTSDGKIATANRTVSSFGGPRDQAHLYELRATADAVMCGARTVEQAAATLGNGAPRHRRERIRRGLAEFPLRILVSGSGSVDPGAPIFTRRFSPILLLTTGRAKPAAIRRLRAVADAVKVCGREELDFARALTWLWEKWNVRRLLCEGGGELNAALFRAGLVDELHLTICPFVLGGRRAPTIADGAGSARLADAAQFRLKSRRRSGDDEFLVFEAVR